MPSSTTSTFFIAFFGATGGCTNACLVYTLKAGLHATALARTPSKLRDMLVSQGISQDTIDNQLTIVQGDIADVSAIKRVLYTTTKNNTTPSLTSSIISGVGGTPQLQKSFKHPVTIDNPEICATATRNILQALHEIIQETSTKTGSDVSKPLMTVISTTGVSNVKEDVPFGFQTLYHKFLAVPHADKKAMEQLIDEHLAQHDQSQHVLRGAVVVRPSLLMGDHLIAGKGRKGYKGLKVGTEDKPAIGYTVHRADVGEWIYEEVVRTGGSSFVGQKVTLTK
ncbi:hypothetical protein BGW42_007577 [Actinomortierella wolfii]|nr:hypothetical protein BGW42_007577 [Actinomortierella wolfii]